MTKVNRTRFGLAQSNSGQIAGHLSRDHFKKPTRDYFRDALNTAPAEEKRQALPLPTPSEA